MLSIEIISNSQVCNQQEDNKTNKINSVVSETIPVETFSSMKISNQYIDNLLNDNPTAKKKQLTCTKCKGSNFNEQDELRKHFKSNWHNFNAKLSAQGKESLTADEYDEFVLINPEILNK